MTPRWAVLVTVAILAATCSDDGGDSLSSGSTSTAPATSSTSTTGSTTSTTSTPGSPSTSTSTSVPAASADTLIDTSFTNDDTTATYRLELDGSLCFTARLDSTNPTLAATFGDAVDDCLDEVTPLDEPISATVGALDGDRQFGYVWGRVTNEATRLELRFSDGSSVPLDLVETDLGIQVFAAVVDTRGLADVDTLAALDGSGAVLGSVSVRSFLRAGPTYPTVAPSTVPPPTYPTS